uniref:Persulfide dioxygenase ETHE1, mitochondrial (inferred by orthology to a human protein) n=1 Tax=Strongyloides venezuelensis TaxID=75913 RepID=A0A0K0ETV6_STRVS
LQKAKNAAISNLVLKTVERDTKYNKELDLNLIYGINTYIHADHITGTGLLKNNISFYKICFNLKIGEINLNFKPTSGTYARL